MIYELARSVMFRMEPENAHRLIMSNIDWAVGAGLTKLVSGAFVRDPVTVMGITFPNAVGLAAGMDKEGAHVSALGSLGFGHIEVGTLTPQAQPGNEKPRLWRLIPAQGIVNHMGFNNCGVDRGVQNVIRSAKQYRTRGGIVGINIGKQNSTAVENALPDYEECMEKAYDAADYLAIDISCPNTPGLTKLQGDGYLFDLVKGIADKRKALADKTGRRVPVTVKIGPDLENGAILSACEVFVKNGIDAVTATNTTTSRKGVEGLPKSENAGGLSGMPLFERSTEVVALIHEEFKNDLPIIATGGVMNTYCAVRKIQAGASLVQIYSGFIYSGPAVVSECADAIARARAGKN